MPKEFTESFRIICADCGINCDLSHCYEDIETEDGTSFRDFALCRQCINVREIEE